MMPTRTLTRLLLALGALTGLLTLSPTIAAPAKPAAAAPAKGDWANKVTLTSDGGHVLGNPDAPLKLTEYMSYTCPHCAHFEGEGVATMRMTVIPQGKVSLEVRHLLRDPIDIAVALLTNCAPPQRFFALHDAFLTQQEHWLAPAFKATQEQQKRWYEGPLPIRMRAVANDLKLYDFVEPKGLSRTEADRCLTNEALAKRIAAQTADATAKGVDSTPSFGLNGVLMTGTHDWATLRPQLDARL
jgi:protein-disulfide isomerase